MRMMLNTIFSLTVLLNKVIGQPATLTDAIRESEIKPFQKNCLTDDERRELTAVLKGSLYKFNVTTSGLSKEQFSFRTKSRSWTIEECIEHVAIAELRFPEIVSEEMKKPSDPRHRKKIRISDHEIIPKMTNRFWKARAPDILRPTGKFLSVENAIISFREQRLKTIDYFNTTEDDLRNHFWRHPLTGTIDLYQTIVLMSAHLERHLAQIEEIKTAKRFPVKN